VKSSKGQQKTLEGGGRYGEEAWRELQWETLEEAVEGKREGRSCAM
jgi:hypothetical protein